MSSVVGGLSPPPGLDCTCAEVAAVRVFQQPRPREYDVSFYHHAREKSRGCSMGRLAPVYDWFTEGFDTTDLNEAKTLLDELK